MLESNDVIGFIPTKDSKRARVFYEKVLGLPFESDDQFALVFRANGTTIRVVKVEDFKPYPLTILGWKVQGIEKMAVDLKERGVKFEKFEGMSQSELGIWSAPGGAKVAWFKDPDGNLLSISQH